MCKTLPLLVLRNSLSLPHPSEQLPNRCLPARLDAVSRGFGNPLVESRPDTQLVGSRCRPRARSVGRREPRAVHGDGPELSLAGRQPSAGAANSKGLLRESTGCDLDRLASTALGSRGARFPVRSGRTQMTVLVPTLTAGGITRGREGLSSRLARSNPNRRVGRRSESRLVSMHDCTGQRSLELRRLT